MRIAVASGKGGTGKTTVATNLAYCASHEGRPVGYLDCDVEDPTSERYDAYLRISMQQMQTRERGGLR